MANDGLTEEDRIKRGKELGEQDYTDFENPYVGIFSPLTIVY